MYNDKVIEKVCVEPMHVNNVNRVTVEFRGSIEIDDFHHLAYYRENKILDVNQIIGKTYAQARDYVMKLNDPVIDLNEEDERFMKVANQAFSKDPEEAFQGSIKLARLSGVPEDEILKSQEDIDRFFLGE